ncbi:hypothetical protein B0H13DRAFT_1901965 [Mycena leptocephala]|nr:hypothetical protein B0H13DRAFT_1901965 [Mycena leptocephala]
MHEDLTVCKGANVLLGPKHVDGEDDRRIYLDPNTGHPKRTLIIGVVVEVFELVNGTKVIFLRAPDLSMPRARNLFESERGVLDEVIESERHDLSPIIEKTQSWSSDGHVAVRMAGDVEDVESYSYAPILDEIAVDDSQKPMDGSVLEAGNLVLFEVEMIRIDAAQEQLSVGGQKLHCRFYVLHVLKRSKLRD